MARGSTWRLRLRCSTDDATQRTIKTEFGNECVVGEHARGQLFVGHEHRNRNRQIEPRATLAFATRGKIHGDASIGPREPARQEGGAHTVAALATHLIGLTDDGETGQSDADVYLDIDTAANDAKQRGRTRRRKHPDTSPVVQLLCRNDSPIGPAVATNAEFHRRHL